MQCKCSRTHVEPAQWDSKDGKTRFRRDQHGITDILAGPKADLFKWLEANGYTSPPDRGTKSSDHIHW